MMTGNLVSRALMVGVLVAFAPVLQAQTFERLPCIPRLPVPRPSTT